MNAEKCASYSGAAGVVSATKRKGRCSHEKQKNARRSLKRRRPGVLACPGPGFPGLLWVSMAFNGPGDHGGILGKPGPIKRGAIGALFLRPRLPPRLPPGEGLGALLGASLGTLPWPPIPGRSAARSYLQPYPLYIILVGRAASKSMVRKK